MCDYIAGWAIRSATDRVLEPSCGEAAFLLAAAARLGTLGAADRSGQLVGVAGSKTVNRWSGLLGITVIGLC